MRPAAIEEDCNDQQEVLVYQEKVRMGLGDAVRVAGLARVRSRIRPAAGGSVSVLSISRAHRVSALHVGRSVGPRPYLLDERRPARLAVGGVERPQKLFSDLFDFDPPGKAWMHCPMSESDSIARRPRLCPL